jgi:hypothetical protein
MAPVKWPASILVFKDCGTELGEELILSSKALFVAVLTLVGNEDVLQGLLAD